VDKLGDMDDENKSRSMDEDTAIGMGDEEDKGDKYEKSEESEKPPIKSFFRK
jgi:hypothetical protein